MSERRQLDLFDAPREAAQPRVADVVVPKRALADQMRWEPVVPGIARAKGWYRWVGSAVAVNVDVRQDTDESIPWAQRRRRHWLELRHANEPDHIVTSWGPFRTQKEAKGRAQLLVDTGELVRPW